MKEKLLYLIEELLKQMIGCFLVLAAVVNASAFGLPEQKEPSLEERFTKPSYEAKPWVYWFWMNGNVTEEGITADLEAMNRVGIGGAQIFSVASHLPKGPIKFNSPEWFEMVKHSAVEARRLGIELGIHNCAGYTSSGGPWNTPENGMKVVVTSEKKVMGLTQFKGKIQQPPTRFGFYRDIAVLAFRTPECEQVEMRDAAPEVTIDSKSKNGVNIVDGNVSTEAELAMPQPSAPSFIKFTFAQPFMARMLTLVAGRTMRGCVGKIEVSDDGKIFRAVRDFTMKPGERTGKFVFAPVSAKALRVRFTSGNNQFSWVRIAEAEFSSKLSIENLSKKTFQERRGHYYKAEPIAPFDVANVVQSDKIVDLSAQITSDGELTWNVPEGNWTILRIGYTPNGNQNHPAPDEGRGLECDKLSRKAVQAHWDGMMGPLLAELGPLAGDVTSGLNNVVIDSYEVGSQNWTQGFEDEFRRRRGYDLRRFLPIFSGRMVDSPEITRRFLWDLRRTIADMFAENYSGQFAKMAHLAGVQYSLEPYGNSPSDDLQYGSYCDIPMSEFWVNDGFAPVNAKISASLAHIYGKKYAAAESFTAAPDNGKWLKDPYSLKAQGDAAYCGGVNRIIYHRYAHQPWLNRFPGMTMGKWGTHFERTLTWWEQGRDWLTYQARCQYLLQQGLFVADVCFYSGEGAPNNVRGGRLPSGYDYDVFDTGALKLMSVKDGRIVLPSGMSYRLLVLPNDTTMTPVTLNRIKQLVDAGATVIGPKPKGSPSLSGYPACDVEVARLADELWPARIRDQSPTEALAALNYGPDVVCDNPQSKITWIHRRIGDADVYFVSSQKAISDKTVCRFRVKGKVPEFWHPDTGVIERAAIYEEKDGYTTVPLNFDPAGSVFVVFRRRSSEDQVVTVRYTPVDDMTRTVHELTILKAVYGFFDEKPRSQNKTVDITAKVAALVKDGTLEACVDAQLAGEDPAPQIVKELRVDYQYKGLRKQSRVRDRRMLILPKESERLVPIPAYNLVARKGRRPQLQVWKPGAFEIKTAAGNVFKTKVDGVPKAFEIPGPWTVTFPPNWGAPGKITLDKLISWTEHPDSGVKYFSGTATYNAVFSWNVRKGPNKRFSLDFGNLKNIAEVALNGKNLGILWKPPFRVDVTDAIRPGENRLRVAVTNMWPNRLIGDEQLPPDCEWQSFGPKNDGLTLKEWPQWLLDGKPSPTGRLTFTTWGHWNKDDKLLPSGLFGPVVIRTIRSVDLN